MEQKPLVKNRLKRQRKANLAAAYTRMHKLALKRGWDAPPAPSTPIAKYWHLWCAKKKYDELRGG